VDPASRGGRARRLLPVALAAAAPWLWFAVRDLDGPMDTVSVGLPIVGVTAIISAAIVAVVIGRAWPLVCGTSIFLVCAVAVLTPRMPRAVAPPDPPIRVVMANVWDANPTPQAVPASLLGRGADVVVAVEMRVAGFAESASTAATAAGLTSAVEDGELGAWSRFPMRELSELELPPARVMRVGVDAPGTPFVLYVVHSLNPLRDTTFSDQRRFIDALLAAISRERRPVVVAGDFNMSDRVASYRVMDTALTDAMRADAAGRTTYVGGWWSAVLLRIDHVFVDPSWCARDPATFVVPGSDHRGVDVTIGPCAS
jgi:endonuclease/exonuclease/phosphatase (EEP) superfamily protein YafD